MKKLLIIIAFCIFIPNIVDAKTVYFTNVNGVELTKQQYENLSKVFSYDTIATLNEEQINLYKNNTNLKAEKTFKYIKIEKDNVKNVYKESIVTQQEAEEFLKQPVEVQKVFMDWWQPKVGDLIGVEVERIGNNLCTQKFWKY